MYSATLSLTLALDGGGWSMPCPGCFTPTKDSAHCMGGWMGVEILTPTRIRSPDHPAHRESLYRLRIPGLLIQCSILICFMSSVPFTELFYKVKSALVSYSVIRIFLLVVVQDLIFHLLNNSSSVIHSCFTSQTFSLS
jgi:hypothetical protein